MKQIEFTPPKGYVSPEGKTEWQQMCTLRQKPNGKMCLVQLGDFNMPGYENKSEPPRDYGKEAGENTAARYSEAMTGKSGSEGSYG